MHPFRTYSLPSWKGWLVALAVFVWIVGMLTIAGMWSR